jgi:hypothetical protein
MDNPINWGDVYEQVNANEARLTKVEGDHESRIAALEAFVAKQTAANQATAKGKVEAALDKMVGEKETK